MTAESNHFNRLSPAPLDAIMAASAGWKDFLSKHPGAVNTTVGIMLDPEVSYPWRPQSVQYAITQADQHTNGAGDFGYQGQAGNPDFLAAAGEYVFGSTICHEKEKTGVLAYQSIGGTGALELAEGALEALLGEDTRKGIPMVLDGGWPNHLKIFGKSFNIRTYPHQNSETGAYDHQAALDAFDAAPDYSVFLLQACGYNDDGMNRTQEQWDDVLAIAEAKKAVVVLDAAYMGLVDGFDRDRYAVEQSVKRGLLSFICFSASKNMGLYGERVGSLYIVNGKENLGAEQCLRLDERIKSNVRSNYSCPPSLMARASAQALQDPAYLDELEQARMRLRNNRDVFADVVGDRLPAVRQGGGLFTKILTHGFSPRQQAVLEELGVYTLPNSRINLGGIHLDQVERVGSAILRALDA